MTGRPLVGLGVALVVAGVIALFVPGITFSRQEHVLDLGPIHATATHRETYPVPRAIAFVAIGAGAVLAIGGMRRT